MLHFLDNILNFKFYIFKTVLPGGPLDVTWNGPARNNCSASKGASRNGPLNTLLIEGYTL